MLLEQKARRGQHFLSLDPEFEVYWPNPKFCCGRVIFDQSEGRGWEDNHRCQRELFACEEGMESFARGRRYARWRRVFPH